MLYVVATPIGNLEDLSARARRVLAEADLVLAEDTRHTAGLLAHCGIATPTRALHEHNERARVEEIVERVAAGARIALVSDAGTPLISDPGYHLVRALHARGLDVVPVPGPSALVCALSAAGLPTDRFGFEGFLPARAAARRARLADLRDRTETLVLYEAPHRVRATLADLVEAFGAERPAALARELTKAFESIHLATLGELLEHVEAHADERRGEMVLVVGGAPQAASARPGIDVAALLGALLESLSPGDAARIAARATGLPRNDLYRTALALKKSKAED